MKIKHLAQCLVHTNHGCIIVFDEYKNFEKMPLLGTPWESTQDLLRGWKDRWEALGAQRRGDHIYNISQWGWFPDCHIYARPQKGRERQDFSRRSKGKSWNPEVWACIHCAPWVVMVRGNPRGKMTPARTESTINRLFIGGGLPFLGGKVGVFPLLVYPSVL